MISRFNGKASCPNKITITGINYHSVLNPIDNSITLVEMLNKISMPMKKLIRRRVGEPGFILAFLICAMFLSLACQSYTGAQTPSVSSGSVILFPADKSKNVNQDTHLKLSFRGVPVLGKSGEIRVYDKANNRLVDLLDLSIPAGPTTRTPSPSATYSPVPYEYVSSIIVLSESSTSGLLTGQCTD